MRWSRRESRARAVGGTASVRPGAIVPERKPCLFVYLKSKTGAREGITGFRRGTEEGSFSQGGSARGRETARRAYRVG